MSATDSELFIGKGEDSLLLHPLHVSASLRSSGLLDSYDCECDIEPPPANAVPLAKARAERMDSNDLVSLMVSPYQGDTWTGAGYVPRNAAGNATPKTC